MAHMLVTFEIFQEERSWSKDLAPRNMTRMSVTFEAFQDEISWWKDRASWNMAHMILTFEVFQEPMFLLNDTFSLNKKEKYRILETSHHQLAIYMFLQTHLRPQYCPLYI